MLPRHTVDQFPVADKSSMNIKLFYAAVFPELYAVSDVTLELLGDDTNFAGVLNKRCEVLNAHLSVTTSGGKYYPRRFLGFFRFLSSLLYQK